MSQYNTTSIHYVLVEIKEMQPGFWLHLLSFFVTYDLWY